MLLHTASQLPYNNQTKKKQFPRKIRPVFKRKTKTSREKWREQKGNVINVNSCLSRRFPVFLLPYYIPNKIYIIKSHLKTIVDTIEEHPVSRWMGGRQHKDHLIAHQPPRDERESIAASPAAQVLSLCG
jgi:hypothetical protein